MPAIINKADTRRTVRDASDDMAKAGINGVAAGSRTAYDASEASGGAVRKSMAAIGHEVT